ncbi:MAG: hypothetical protein GY810_18585 [Aureispira sp.]|nr:hypothetical protein [Aureispira sp.]
MTKLLNEVIDHYPQLKYTLLDVQTFDPEHFGFSSLAYTMMETDKARVDAFVKGFKKFDFFKDKIVCEGGIGRLALTEHYLPYVKKAYLIENNPNILPLIKDNIARNGWSHKVELLEENALTVKLPEPVDHTIGELMSIYCANEMQVQIFKNLRQFLKPGGKLFPERVVNLVQLGYTEFDGKYKHFPVLGTRYWPTLLSSQEVVNITNLYTEEDLTVRCTIPLKIRLTGKLNCVFLHSWVQVTEGANFAGSDSLMPPTVVELEETVDVQAGTTVNLEVYYEYGTSLDYARFRIV